MASACSTNFFRPESLKKAFRPKYICRAKAQAECLIQGKMGIVSCPTLSSDYFCLKYFGFVYDQSLQWKSSLDPIFLTMKQAVCNVFFLVNKIMELRQKLVSQPFTKCNTKLFLNLVGKCGGILIFFSLRKTFLNPSECNLPLADLVT